MMNDADIEMQEPYRVGNRLAKAKDESLPLPDREQTANLMAAARRAWLTGESMTGAVADEAVEQGVQLTDSQLWACQQEAQVR